METHATRRRLTRLGATLAVIVGASALTPAEAHAASSCAALAAGAYRAVYNTTGSTFLAAEAWEFQYYSCRAVEWLTS
jgi:hypothetical protein